MQKIFTFIFTFMLFNAPIFAQLTIDGVSDESYWLTQTSGTSCDGYGTSGAVSSLKTVSDNTYIYVAVTGDITSNNHITIFFDFSGYDGVNDGTALPNGGSDCGTYFNRIAGTKLGGGNVDYGFTLNKGLTTTTMYYDGVRYGNTPSILNQGSFGSSDLSGTATTLGVATPWGGTGDILVAFKEGGGTNQGLELRIPYTALPGVMSDQTMKVFVAITNDADGAFNCNGNSQKSQVHFSDEFLPNLSSCGNKGIDPDMSGLSLFSNPVVLDIALMTLSAKKSANGNEIIWTTSTERNNTVFNVQRSSNNQTWQTIGTVKATNNPSGAKYNFTDNTPLSTVSYYRLQMVDNGGKMTYSKVVAVNNDDRKQALTVYPNPVKTELNILTNANTDGITIYDMTGKMLRQFNDNRTKADVQDLPNGIYFVRLSDKNGLFGEAIRFVKQ